MTREEFSETLRLLLVASANSNLTVQDIYAEAALFMKQVDFLFDSEMNAALDESKSDEA